MPVFSDYIIYVDESGDHSLNSIDPDYPVFVLAFCIINKVDYKNIIVPAIKQLKFDLFGHDDIVFHEREIRKAEREFSILLNPEKRTYFHDSMNKIMEDAPITIIATAISKTNLTDKYSNPDNPYNLGLGLCMERAALFLEQQGQADKLTHIIVESRGRNEDRDLELSFRQIIDGVRVGSGLAYNIRKAHFDLRFTKKQANMAGLQLADMIARPIGRHVINRTQKNRAMDLIFPKIFTTSSTGGSCLDLGLKVFPCYP